MNKSIPLVVCVDRGALIGLHVTLRSAMQHLAAGVELEIHVLHDALKEGDFGLLEQTLCSSGKPFRIVPQQINLDQFQGLRNHVGHGWMTYARILAPEIVAAERLVYLDADLIVHADLNELLNQPLDGHVLGAVSWGPIQGSNDERFFQELNWDLNGPYFNAGVLLIDVAQWRRQTITNRCLEVATQFGNNLPTADQTILNYIFAGKFATLPRRYNTVVTASRPPIKDEDWINRIVHLVGRPKPWDPFGFLNGQSRVFYDELKHTAVDGQRNYRLLSLATFRSCFRLSAAYRKCIWRRIVG